MLNSFELSKVIQKDYNFSIELDDNLILNYQNENNLKQVKYGKKVVMCYGYCFDVRNPQTSVIETLTRLIKNSEDFYNNLKYLNGHYILIFKLDDKWELITDTVSFTPVYYSTENRIVTTNNTNTSFPSLNGFMILNISDYTISRMNIKTEKLTNEQIEKEILKLVQNQYKYFIDKNITLNFKRNRMNKAIISILKPILYYQNINIRDFDDVTVKISKWLARDYKMEILNGEINLNSEYMCNTHLMNFKYYLGNRSRYSDVVEQRMTIEDNIKEKLKYREEESEQLIYDPFNVFVIQEVIYEYEEEEKFDPLNRIISIINPSIDFYDFATGETLIQKYRKVKKKLNSNQKNKGNNQFVRDAEKKGITVSNNLNGSILTDGIIVYPLSQNISKNEIFEVSFNKNSRMVLVESYFNNPKNSSKIKVNLNGITYNINDFVEGKFVTIEQNFTLNFFYEKDYNAKSWQKAGKLSIREIN